MASCSLVLFVTKGPLCMHTSWGVSVISVDLELDVNTPLGFADPIGLDTDEEITVDVTITMFKASLSLIE